MKRIWSLGEEDRQAQPAARAAPTSVGKLPGNVFRYALATSGVHQLLLLLLTVAVFLLEIVPLELQRRIVNDLVKDRSYRWVILLCTIYAGVVLVQGGTKLVLNVYRGWVGERAIRDLRRRIHNVIEAPAATASPAADCRRGRSDRRVRRRGYLRAADVTSCAPMSDAGLGAAGRRARPSVRRRDGERVPSAERPGDPIPVEGEPEADP